jgi:16S rRNA (guanine527-N7)-methyltransferase
MLPPELESLLRTGARELGCPLTDAQAVALLAYLSLLIRWNRTYNLTAVRDPRQMLIQHLLDSLSIIGPLRRHTAGNSFRLLDVGSGGGLPGVVIAAVLPAASVTCVEAVGKKAAFIRQAALEMGLANLDVAHSRVEAIELGRFDVVTSRAFASLQDFVSLTHGKLSPGGLWVAMKGQLPDAEIHALDPQMAAVFHVEQLTVPFLEGRRCLVWMRPPSLDEAVKEASAAAR